MKIKQSIGIVGLALAATIWGTSFVAQSVGMEYVGPYTFNAVRFMLGGIVLLPLIACIEHFKKGEVKKERKKETKILMLGGMLCGIALAVASSLQQIGIQYTTVGKAGFITALYIVIVPILGCFFKKKIGIQTWISVVIALIGLYLMCISESFDIEKGDVYELFCALGFSIHILLVDYFVPKLEGVKLSCIQFFVAGILCCIPMFLLEEPKLEPIYHARMYILYVGIMSCGVAYTLQILGQKNVNPTIASMVMSMESAVSALAGAFILHEILSGREILGCIMMFTAIMLTQLPLSKEKQL